MGKSVSTRILVVDDDPVVTRMLSRVLSDYVVVVAESGRDGLERLEQDAFDVVLCDLNMPGMSGMDFYEAARAADPERASRIVFMTGGALTAESYEFLSRLPNSWLEKPFDLGALRRLVLGHSRPAPRADSA